jgi:pimeloyl-ACP methyl ester carboxylesterase
LTLICVPGIGDVRTSFRFLAKSFQDKHRIIVTDIRGFGDSHAFSKFTPEDVADDMKCIMEYFELQSGVVLVTNSLSTGSAAIVATEENPAVKAIILLAPIVRDLPADKYFRPVSHCLFVWPWGTPLWTSYYKGLYKRKVNPADFDDHIAEYIFEI